MKTLVISTVAFGMIFGLSAAQAQDQGGDTRHPAEHQREAAPMRTQGAETRTRAPMSARMGTATARPDRTAIDRTDVRRAATARATARTKTTTSRGVWKAPAGRTASPTMNRAPNNNAMTGSSRSRNVDVSRFQGNVTSSRHFHAGNYRGPSGYSYRHWSFGDRLPSIYFARDYWLADFLIYGLMEPPYGYEWVRYGPDALLIDLDTGEIVRVEYNVFY